MNAGTLDRRITIQQRTDARDAAGEPIPTWSTLAEVWAKLESLQPYELAATQLTQAEKPVRFYIRHRTDVDETMRVSWDGEEWDIEGISEIGRREGLALICKARP